MNASADELRMILAYVEAQLAEIALLLSDPPSDDLARYWRHWQAQYAWWHEKTSAALDARAQQEGAGDG